jgi:hypothetical protein
VRCGSLQAPPLPIQIRASSRAETYGETGARVIRSNTYSPASVEIDVRDSRINLAQTEQDSSRAPTATSTGWIQQRHARYSVSLSYRAYVNLRRRVAGRFSRSDACGCNDRRFEEHKRFAVFTGRRFIAYPRRRGQVPVRAILRVRDCNPFGP